MTIKGKPFSVPSYAVQLLSGSIHLKLQKHGTKKAQFFPRFTEGKMQYRIRTGAENLKRQPNENIKSYIHRVKTLVD